MGTRGFPRVERALRIFPRALDRRMGQALRASGAHWHSEMVRTRFNAPLTIFPQRSRRTNLHTRTGALKRSLGFSVTRGQRGPKLDVYSQGTPHARIQELGGTITPKRAKWLTIPAAANLTPAGVTRQSARQIVSEGGIFLRTKEDGLILVKPNPKKGKFEIYFYLLKKVTIPEGRLGMRKVWGRQESRRRQRFSQAVRKALQDVAYR